MLSNSSFGSILHLGILTLGSFFGDSTESKYYVYILLNKQRKVYLPSPLSKIIGFLSTSSSSSTGTLTSSLFIFTEICKC